MNQKYLAVYTQGLNEDIQLCIKADAENIAAFIAKYPLAPKITMETLDGHFLLNTRLGFIDKCYDQTYLATQLIPVLAPMQMGERDIPEVVAITDYSELTMEDAPHPLIGTLGAITALQMRTFQHFEKAYWRWKMNLLN